MYYRLSENSKDRLRLSGVRRAAAEMAWTLSGLRRVELARRRAAGAADRARGGKSSLRPRLGRRVGEALQRHSDVRCAAHVVGDRRVRSCARRGNCARARWCCSAANPASASPRCCCRLRRTSRGTVGPVLYSSGEESEHQIKLRGERLAVDRAPLYLLAETCLERILEEIERLKPALVVVDSIQTIFSARFQSAPGSIGQVREVATHLLFAAKGRNVPIVLVGHVTKDGNLAGPKALEHVVDTVLYFEGERHHAHRVVRAFKNGSAPRASSASSR